MKPKKDWKYYLGITLIIYSFIPYAISGLLLFLKIPLGNMIAIIGIFIASAEVAFVASIILLGKTVVITIKEEFKKLFLRRKTPQITQTIKPISKRRHYFGVSLMLASFLPDIIAMICLLFGYPQTQPGDVVLLLIMLSGATMFILGLFVMGDDFWDRLKKLFQWQEITVKT